MACIGVGRMEEAEQLLVAMQDAGFTPDVRAHNILLTGLARCPSPTLSPFLLLVGI